MIIQIYLNRIDLYYGQKLKKSDQGEDLEAFISDAAETISLSEYLKDKQASPT